MIYDKHGKYKGDCNNEKILHLIYSTFKNPPLKSWRETSTFKKSRAKVITNLEQIVSTFKKSYNEVRAKVITNLEQIVSTFKKSYNEVRAKVIPNLFS